MLLIDKKGSRPICRECRKIHSPKDCPKRRAIRIAPRMTARARKYAARPYADAV